MENEFPNAYKCAHLKQNRDSGAFYCVRRHSKECDERYCSSYETIADYHRKCIKCAKRIMTLPEQKMIDILRKYYNGNQYIMYESYGTTEEEIIKFEDIGEEYDFI